MLWEVVTKPRGWLFRGRILWYNNEQIFSFTVQLFNVMRLKNVVQDYKGNLLDFPWADPWPSFVQTKKRWTSHRPTLPAHRLCILFFMTTFFHIVTLLNKLLTHISGIVRLLASSVFHHVTRVVVQLPLSFKVIVLTFVLTFLSLS